MGHGQKMAMASSLPCEFERDSRPPRLPPQRNHVESLTGIPVIPRRAPGANGASSTSEQQACVRTHRLMQEGSRRSSVCVDLRARNPSISSRPEGSHRELSHRVSPAGRNWLRGKRLSQAAAADRHFGTRAFKGRVQFTEHLATCRKGNEGHPCHKTVLFIHTAACLPCASGSSLRLPALSLQLQEEGRSGIETAAVERQ